MKVHDPAAETLCNGEFPEQSVQQKSDAPQNNCVGFEGQIRKSCDAPSSTAPAQPTQDKNRTPEKSDDDNSMPNPQRLLHSI